LRTGLIDNAIFYRSPWDSFHSISCALVTSSTFEAHLSQARGLSHHFDHPNFFTSSLRELLEYA